MESEVKNLRIGSTQVSDVYFTNQFANIFHAMRVYQGEDLVYSLPFYTVSFTASGGYGSWADATAISVPEGTTIAQDGKYLDFMFNNRVLYTKILNVNNDTDATASAQIGYHYDYNITITNFTVVSDMVISATTTRSEKNYWVTFSGNAYGTVSPTTAVIPAGASVSTSGNNLIISSTTITPTLGSSGSGSGYFYASQYGTSAAVNAAFNNNSYDYDTDTRNYYSYTQPRTYGSGWNKTSGTITEPQNIMFNFGEGTRNYSYGTIQHLITINHPSASITISNTYNGVTESKSTLYGLKVTDGNGNMLVDRLTSGTASTWVDTGTTLYFYGYTSNNVWGSRKPSIGITITFGGSGSTVTHNTTPYETSSVAEYRRFGSMSSSSFNRSLTIEPKSGSYGLYSYASASNSGSSKPDFDSSASWSSSSSWTTGYAYVQMRFSNSSFSGAIYSYNGAQSSNAPKSLSLPRGSNQYDVWGSVNSYDTSSISVKYYRESSAVWGYGWEWKATFYRMCP